MILDENVETFTTSENVLNVNHRANKCLMICWWKNVRKIISHFLRCLERINSVTRLTGPIQHLSSLTQYKHTTREKKGILCFSHCFRHIVIVVFGSGGRLREMNIMKIQGNGPLWWWSPTRSFQNTHRQTFHLNCEFFLVQVNDDTENNFQKWSNLNVKQEKGPY